MPLKFFSFGSFTKGIMVSLMYGEMMSSLKGAWALKTKARVAKAAVIAKEAMMVVFFMASLYRDKAKKFDDIRFWFSFA